MAKVKQKVAKQGAAGASTRGAQISKQKKHKIAVQGDPRDKKLPTVVRKKSARVLAKSGFKTRLPDPQKIAFTDEPPPGYTFITAGNPELTNALKEFALRADQKIFVVTITPHGQRHELSREIHRVGYHFPTTVVDQVCAHYGIRLNSKGELVDESKDDALFKRVYQNADGQRPEEEKDQVTINTEAKQTIKDLFPKIPDNDLFKIIKTAFQLGDGRVGTAPELSLLRRAHLSVVAHIRHNYTSYDKLLRQISYNEARHQVEKETLEKIIEWRGGEDMTVENTRGDAADDLLKEVIVISDEEETESDADDIHPVHHEQIRVEELPSSWYERDYTRALSPIAQSHREPVQPYPRPVRIHRPSDAQIAQRTQTRYAVWEQARRDYQSRLAQNTTVLERVYKPEPAAHSRILVPLDPPAHPRAPIFHTETLPPRTTRVEYEVRLSPVLDSIPLGRVTQTFGWNNTLQPLPPRQPTPPKFIRDAHGVLFERVEPQVRELRPQPPQRYYQNEVPTMTGALVRARPASPQESAQPAPRYQGNPEPSDGIVLPSVEGSDGSYLPPRTRRNPFDRQAESREANIVRQERTSRDVAYIDLTSSSSQTPKRRRLEEVPPPSGRLAGEGSPGRPVERYYLPQHQRTTHVEPRRIEHGELHYSPQHHQSQAISVRDDPYAARQPVYETREASRPVTRVYEPMPYNRELQAATVAQSHHRPQNYSAVTRNHMETTLPAGNINTQPPLYAGRVFEPVVESHKYDSRVDREHFRPVREHVQPRVQETRVRYVYEDGTEVREPLQSLPPQRVLEYERSGAPVRAYAR